MERDARSHDASFRELFSYAREMGFLPQERVTEIETRDLVMTVHLFFSDESEVLYLVEFQDKSQQVTRSMLFDVVAQNDPGENKTILLRVYSREGRTDVDMQSGEVVNAPNSSISESQSVSCNPSVCFGYALEWSFYHSPLCQGICENGFYEVVDLVSSLSKWSNGQADPSYNPAVDIAWYLTGDLVDLVQNATLTACPDKSYLLAQLQSWESGELLELTDYATAAQFSHTLNDFVGQQILGKCELGVGSSELLSVVDNFDTIGNIVDDLPDYLSQATAFKAYSSLLLEGIVTKVLLDLSGCPVCIGSSIIGGWLACQVNPCGFYPCQTICQAQDYSFSSSPYCKNDDLYQQTHTYAYTCSSTVPTEGTCMNDASIAETLVEDCAYGCDTTASQCKSSCSTGYPGKPETCNGVDDNCNSIIDEGCSCMNGSTKICGTDAGTCTYGIQTCTNGQWGSCLGGQGPVNEACPKDGIDNDCDSQVDENFCEGDGNECYDSTYVAPEGKIESVSQGAYCAENYVWHEADVDSDGWVEHYMLVGDTHKVWFKCKVKDLWSVTDIDNFNTYTPFSYGCYDGTCNQTFEKTITKIKTFTSPSTYIDYPSVFCLVENWWAGWWGEDMYWYWDTNPPNGKWDEGEHKEYALVLNCGVDSDCGPGKYCKKPDNYSPQSNTCVSCLQAEICTDGVDNDCDGFVDCSDGDCGLGTPSQNGFCCGTSCSANGGNCADAPPSGITCSDGFCSTYGEACRNGELESTLQCNGTAVTCNSGGSCKESFGAPPSCDGVAPGENACEKGGSFNERACEVTGTDCSLSAESGCGAPLYCDEKIDNACSQITNFKCSLANDDITETCSSACGSDPVCDNELPGEELPGCGIEKTYFSDACSSICTSEDKGPICRSSVYALGCTADPFCEGAVAGTQDCTATCQKNTPPSPPTSMFCNDENCTGFFSNIIEVACDGSMDVEQEPIIYSIEAFVKNEMDPAQPGWWNPSFSHCISVTLDASSPLEYVNEPVDLLLDSSTWLDAPFKDSLRVVNQPCGQGGQEIPSQTYESTLNGNAYESTRLAFLANRPADSSVSYGIYYATTDQGSPSYNSDLVQSGDCATDDCSVENGVMKALIDHDGGVVYELFYKPFSSSQGLIGWNYETDPGSLGMMTNATWTGPGSSAIFDRTVTDATCALVASGPIFADVVCAKPGGIAEQSFRFYRETPFIDIQSTFNGGTPWGDTLAFYSGASTGPSYFFSSYGSTPTPQSNPSSSPILNFGTNDRTRIAISKPESTLPNGERLGITYSSRLPHVVGLSDNGGSPSFGGTWYPLSNLPFSTGKTHEWRLTFTQGDLNDALGMKSIAAHDRFINPLLPTPETWEFLGNHFQGGSALVDTTTITIQDELQIRCRASATGQLSAPIQALGTMQIDPHSPLTTGNFPSGWQDTNVTIALSCSDTGGAGCAKTHYCMDSNDSCTPSTLYENPVPVTDEGIAYLRFQSTDQVNNVEVVQSQSVSIDKFSPIITIISPQNKTYHATSIPLQYTVEDAGSGVESCEYVIDGNPPQPCENTVLELSPGTHTLQLTAFDMVGHESTKTVLFMLNNPPTTPTSLLCNGKSCQGMYIKSVNLSCGGSIDTLGVV
jgi:hypothetical protein